MARRRAARRTTPWGWLALLGLAISAVAFGRSPEIARGPTEPQAAPQAQRRVPPARVPPRRVPSAPAAPPRAGKPPLSVGSPFFLSAPDCERALHDRRVRTRREARVRPRVGSWNLRWFPRGSAHGRDLDRRTDVRWMACAIASLDVDVLALQEVLQDPEGRAALLDLGERLDALTGGRWRAQLDECAGSGRQHVGFLYDARRVQLRDARAVDALNPGRSACDRSLRPGFGAHVRFADGSAAQLIAVHADSGTTQRDFDNRQRSMARLGDVLAGLRRDDHDAIVLGDFNTMGCKDCVPAHSAADELAAFDAQLTTLQLKRVGADDTARCSQYYRGHAGLLDHVLVSSASPRWSRSALETFGPCAALACASTPRGRSLSALTTLSDHCPLVASPLPRRK
ncbi:MAG TPA: endonuclease/exonuclease/phosphatase family protein [Polyangiales bacterium]|nr:endonuclease/exonuclease/phosphatase family protein [Polyangiales bacterium]